MLEQSLEEHVFTTICLPISLALASLMMKSANHCVVNAPSNVPRPETCAHGPGQEQQPCLSPSPRITPRNTQNHTQEHSFSILCPRDHTLSGFSRQKAGSPAVPVPGASRRSIGSEHSHRRLRSPLLPLPPPAARACMGTEVSLN